MFTVKHPQACRCSAWSYWIGGKVRRFAVLGCRQSTPASGPSTMAGVSSSDAASPPDRLRVWIATSSRACASCRARRSGANIRFSPKPYGKPKLVATDIGIENTGDVAIKLDVTYNPILDSINLNVSATGEGPICRLDVRHTNHRESGRTHKHELTSEKDVPTLPFAIAVPEAEDLPLEEAFRLFCRMSNIEFEGSFHEPGGTS